ncbi:MAG: hypothetical protein VW771_05875, partial [Gammaproteobacteria bacterium]
MANRDDSRLGGDIGLKDALGGRKNSPTAESRLRRPDGRLSVTSIFLCQIDFGLNWDLHQESLI